MLEAEVHSELRAFLREQNKPSWPHHLTMARLVARALRLGRSALIETGTVPQKYCLSYLAPALLSPGSVLLVAPTEVQQLVQAEIPQLQRQLGTDKEIQAGDWFGDRFQGLHLTTPQSWLADRLKDQGRFPYQVPTLIEGADNLEEWARKELEVSLRQGDWNQLIQTYPDRAESIRNVLVQLTKALFSHPPNPYGCCFIDKPERDRLQLLLETLAKQGLTGSVSDFWQQWQSDNRILWAALDRESGQFTLHISPGSVAKAMHPIWAWQPVVLMGSFLDGEKEAPIYRQQLGLEEILTLKFSGDRQNEPIQLYLPDRLPMPNTPQFQGVLFEQIRRLIRLSSPAKPIVLIVEDVPLKAQVGTTMASEFGSRVQVERLKLADNGVLVCGWKFWQIHQERLPTPQLLVVATLPLPSLENPLVAGRVAYYKRQHQDWFRLYLLPTALRELQRAVIPIRSAHGVVALLDNRVNHRSYGSKILNALEPYARINYLDSSWLNL